jgi:hypothetical protein
LGRKRKIDEQPPAPKLLDRVLQSSTRRVAILGLHPRAGTRTVLAALVRELHRRELPYGVTSFPRLQVEDEITPEPITRIALPAGAYLATASGEAGAEIEAVEETRFEAPLGPVGMYRVAQGGEIELCGPEQPEAMGAALSRLAELSGGVALVDGGWDRRGFTAPGVTDGIILVLAAGYSATPERAAAAARFAVDTFSLEEANAEHRAAWREAAVANKAWILDGDGACIDALPLVGEDPLGPLAGSADGVDAVVLPHNLNDDLLAPLVRGKLRFTLVVRDPTRINVSPVYLAAWRKAGGSVRAIQVTRIVAVATNPVNFTGSDADAEEFRALVTEALPEVPVHDVALESEERSRRPVWKFWESSRSH